MKSGKVSGPTELVGEMIREAGQAGVKKKMKVYITYLTCVRSAVVYGSETWAMNVKQSAKLEQAE